MEAHLDERLTKLLQVALDDRCPDGERIAALNAAGRAADAGKLASTLTRRPPQEFALAMEQHLELLQARIVEQDMKLAAAHSEIARLKARRTIGPEDGIDLDTVIRITGLSRATLYRRMAAAQFPPPRGSAGRMKLWERSEINNWKDLRDNGERHASQSDCDSCLE
jgi:predicted DNA-binding transcriptional regulator AlpA